MPRRRRRSRRRPMHGLTLLAVLLALGYAYWQRGPERVPERVPEQVAEPDATVPLPPDVAQPIVGEARLLADWPAYPVDRVVDGDTVRVFLGDESESVRLIGVDTPETVHPRQPVEYFGREASAFTKRLLDGERVHLVPDARSSSELERDRYGRVLAYVYRQRDRLFVNAELVRQGYGHAYTKYPFTQMEQFRRLERQAREAERGLWGDGGVPVD